MDKLAALDTTVPRAPHTALENHIRGGSPRGDSPLFRRETAMKDSNIALSTGEILLPAHGLNYEKWAVVACDQFTAEPDYWHGVEAFVRRRAFLFAHRAAGALSGRAQAAHPRDPRRHARLSRQCRARGRAGRLRAHPATDVLRPPARACWPASIWSSTTLPPAAKASSAPRRAPCPSACRPAPRSAPARPLECPHVMMLIDDPGHTVIEPGLRRPPARSFTTST